MSRRQQQAAQTRRDIVAAARRLFAAQGYAGTSMSAVAAEAGVSVQTIYDAVGSKAALVASLNDLLDEEADVAAIARTIPDLTDPDELVAVAPRITRRLVERCGDVLRVSANASAAEPELASLDAVGRERHRAGTARVVARLEAVGALAVPAAEAERTLAALTDSASALLWVDRYEGSPAQWQEWVTGVLTRLLLR